MQGYDKDAAVKFITANIDKASHKGFSPKEIDSLLLRAVELDLKYMEENGIIVNGMAGDNYYDDDEAFEYISENVDSFILIETIKQINPGDVVSIDLSCCTRCRKR